MGNRTSTPFPKNTKSSSSSKGDINKCVIPRKKETNISQLGTKGADNTKQLRKGAPIDGNKRINNNDNKVQTKSNNSNNIDAPHHQQEEQEKKSNNINDDKNAHQSNKSNSNDTNNKEPQQTQTENQYNIQSPTKSTNDNNNIVEEKEDLIKNNNDNKHGVGNNNENMDKNIIQDTTDKNKGNEENPGNEAKGAKKDININNEQKQEIVHNSNQKHENDTNNQSQNDKPLDQTLLKELVAAGLGENNQQSKPKTCPSNHGSGKRGNYNGNRWTQKRNNNNNDKNNENNNDGGNGSCGHGGDDGDDEKKKNNPSDHVSDDDDEEEEEEEEETEKMDSVSLNSLKSIDEDDNEDKYNMDDNGQKERDSLPQIWILLGADNKEHKIKSKEKAAVEYGYDPRPIFSAKNYIKIPEQLTKVTLPKRMNKEFTNLYRYIYKTISLQLSNDKYYTLCNTETIIIVSTDLCDYQTKDKLYCFIKKEKWEHKQYEIEENAYSMKEIVNKFTIDNKRSPDSFRNATEFKSCLNHENKIKDIINEPLNINKIKWCKITIKQRPNNTKRRTLFLNKKEFIKSLTNYMSKKEIILIDILIFDNDPTKDVNKYHIEYVWIVRIAENTDIGISFIHNQETNSFDINGIHLDKTHLLEQHELINKKNHECHCLDSFESNIDDLRIGNPDDDRNTAKAHKKRIVSLKKEKNEMTQVIKQQQAEIERLKKESNEKDEINKQVIKQQQAEIERLRQALAKHTQNNNHTPSVSMNQCYANDHISHYSQQSYYLNASTSQYQIPSVSQSISNGVINVHQPYSAPDQHWIYQQVQSQIVHVVPSFIKPCYVEQNEINDLQQKTICSSNSTSSSSSSSTYSSTITNIPQSPIPNNSNSHNITNSYKQ